MAADCSTASPAADAQLPFLFSSAAVRAERRRAAIWADKHKLQAAYDRIKGLEAEIVKLRLGGVSVSPAVRKRRGKCGPWRRANQLRADAAEFTPAPTVDCGVGAQPADVDDVLDALGAFAGRSAEAGFGPEVARRDALDVLGEGAGTTGGDVVACCVRDAPVPVDEDLVLGASKESDADPPLVSVDDGSDVHESDFVEGLECCRWAAVVVDEVPRSKPSKWYDDGVVGPSPEEHPTATPHDSKIVSDSQVHNAQGDRHAVSVAAQAASGQPAAASEPGQVLVRDQKESGKDESREARGLFASVTGLVAEVMVATALGAFAFHPPVVDDEQVLDDAIKLADSEREVARLNCRCGKLMEEVMCGKRDSCATCHLRLFNINGFRCGACGFAVCCSCRYGYDDIAGDDKGKGKSKGKRK